MEGTEKLSQYLSNCQNADDLTHVLLEAGRFDVDALVATKRGPMVDLYGPASYGAHYFLGEMVQKGFRLASIRDLDGFLGAEAKDPLALRIGDFSGISSKPPSHSPLYRSLAKRFNSPEYNGFLSGRNVHPSDLPSFEQHEVERKVRALAALSDGRYDLVEKELLPKSPGVTRMTRISGPKEPVLAEVASDMAAIQGMAQTGSATIIEHVIHSYEVDGDDIIVFEKLVLV